MNLPDSTPGSTAAVGAQELELQNLLGRVAGKDREAFSSFYDLTSDRVFGLAVRLVRNHSLAEEIAQETYLQVWQTAERFDGSKGKSISWLLTICHRRSVDRVRSEESRKQREQTDALKELDPIREDFADDFCNALDAQQIRRNVQDLPPKQEESIALVYFQGLTAQEAADELSLPLPTVKTRLRDGLKNLRKDLGRA